MVGLRKACAYSRRNVHPFTRISKRRQKAYIKVVPPQKIVKFVMGNNEMLKTGKLPFKLIMISDENCQIRHNSLESCRQFVNKKLDELVPNQYLFKVVPYPHHIQRENKMLVGAGADRMSRGMQLAFGRSTGKAAIMKKNARILELNLPNEKAVADAREVLKQIKSKLPCRTRVLFENTSIVI